ncbi:hypothetical protein TBGT1765_02832 [Thermotoga sp. TBGT1765]|nr:hypothetical protein TBGT1765_02832 [Thermotoga sp. TBGT1765]KHC94342.1 hypothetical protein TBGT1766_02514 [Thermotoga sp. TBGT1766]KHC95720.1 hypothetical protein XYL54_07496 [Thermotoga sp. Xyl54]
MFMKKEVVASNEFPKEFKELIERYVPKQRRSKLKLKYANLINILSNEGERAITQPYFEKLRGTGDVDLYSLRLEKKNPNIRIIFSFWKSYVILLCAFLEKEKGDYDKAINSAKRRFKNIVEHL